MKQQKTSAEVKLYASIAIVLLLSVGTLGVHAPGSFTQDSFFMLNEALTTKVGHFEEWYSPAYALIWKGMIASLKTLHMSPFVQVSTMCVLQTVLIVGALVQLVRAQGGLGWLETATFSTGVVIWPAIFVYFGEIWRDVLMAALLLVAVCFLDLFSRKDSRKYIVAGIASLFIAALIRQNAFIAEVPLFLWAALLWTRYEKKRLVRVPIFAGALILLLAGFLWVSNSLLAATNYGRGASSIMYYDLIGISARTNELLLPRPLTQPNYSLQTVRGEYQTEYNDLSGLILPTTAEQMKVVTSSWRDAVFAHPKAYLQHRWAVTIRFLGISDLPHLPYAYGIPESLYPSYIQNTTYYVRFPVTPMRTETAALLSDSTYWFFRPWVYGALAFAILLLRWRELGTPFWLCASGALYWLSCFFSVPSTDFRYSWWNTLAVMVALALIIAESVAKRPRLSL